MFLAIESRTQCSWAECMSLTQNSCHNCRFQSFSIGIIPAECVWNAQRFIRSRVWNEIPRCVPIIRTNHFQWVSSSKSLHKHPWRCSTFSRRILPCYWKLEKWTCALLKSTCVCCNYVYRYFHRLNSIVTQNEHELHSFIHRGLTCYPAIRYTK